jgi:ABC-type bacteriocin/lantibiotic exporter with double-glycine peptidase domain
MALDLLNRAICLALLLVSASAHVALAGPSEQSALPSNLLRLPLVRQATDYTCGVAALQSVFAYYGEDLREDLLARALRANRHEGTRCKRIETLARKHGYDVQVVEECSLDELKRFIAAGKPVLVLLQAWPDKEVDFSKDWKDGHYVVAVGFNTESVYFMDPSTSGQYVYIPASQFERRWHDVDGHTRLQHFAMAISKAGATRNLDSAVLLK